MKILVFSDTHNSSSRILNVLEKEKKLDACIFLGDGARDADDVGSVYPQLPLYRVRGNCDFGSLDPEEGLAVFDGLLVYYTHGHQYNVKFTLETLWQAAHSRGADIALFGHTHRSYHAYYEGIHLFNPGSLNDPRQGGPTYGLISIKDGEAGFAICPYTKR